MLRENKVDFHGFDEKLNKFKAALEKYLSDVIVVYLFGSSARGETKPLSDIDIALLLNDDSDEHNIEARILIDAMKMMETEKIDMINLNHAPLHIRYGVLKDRKILYCSDHTKRADFETSVVMEYLDFAHIRSMFYQDFMSSLGVGSD
jgi:predicted nucleotidyltransferase